MVNWKVTTWLWTWTKYYSVFHSELKLNDDYEVQFYALFGNFMKLFNGMKLNMIKIVNCTCGKLNIVLLQIEIILIADINMTFKLFQFEHWIYQNVL